MAWYSELKRRKWYCICGIDMVYVYRKKLYDDWWSSLTDEEKSLVEDRRRIREEQRKRELRTSLAELSMITQHIVGMSSRNSYKGSYYDIYK